MVKLLLAALLLCPAQEPESAATSPLAGAALPAGAYRLRDKDQIEKSSVILKAVAKDVPVAKVEVLLWAGDYSGDKGAALRADLGKALEKESYAWKDAKAEEKFDGNDVYLSSATKADRRLVGVWLSSKDGALFVWGEVAAAEPTFGNVVYSVPKGWKLASAAADGVTFVPVDPLPEEKLFLLLLAGRDYGGSLARDAGTLWTEVCTEMGVTGAPWSSEKSDARRSFKGWDYIRYGTTVKKGDADLYLAVTFIHVGGRLERVAAVSNLVSPPHRETPTNNPRYSPTLQGFPFTLKFKNHPEPELKTPLLTGDGIVGLWVGISLRVSGTGRATWDGSYAAFYSNGLALFSSRLPTNSFQPMNPYHQAEESPRWWGTWTFADGRGVLKMPYGEIPLEAKAADLVLTTMKTPHTYQRIAPVDGARLDGTWTMSANPGDKIPKITFREDGTFSDDGALKVLEHHLYRLYGIAAKPGDGTYEVKNFTMLFHYADGREFSAACLDLQKGNPQPASFNLGVNQDPLKRQ